VSSLSGFLLPSLPLIEEAQPVQSAGQVREIVSQTNCGNFHSRTDDELIEEILFGQTQIYEYLFQRHLRRVITIAWHFFRSKETVEDITQETFAKAYFSLSSYRRGASFEQWLAKIAINNCYDELRRRKKRNEYLITDLTENEADWLESKLSNNAFEEFLGVADKQNAVEVIYKLLSKLPPDDRLVLTLLHAHDYSVKEIAQILEWSEAKVKIRAFRARHHLRRAFNKLSLAEQRKYAHSHNNL
jgi:RNA polymerase sigma-70 factor (ECF subfamily)